MRFKSIHYRRCKLLLHAAFAVALVSPFASGAAESYPSKPIRLIVNSAPGSAPDVLARIVGERLGAELGQRIVVDNRAGATGTIGAALIAQSQHDGYTLGISAAAISTTAAVMKLPYDVRKDLTGVAGIASVPLLLVVSPAIGVISVRGLIDLVKASPGKYSYASPGVGGLQHLVTELFAQTIGARMTHIPYKGGSLAVLGVIQGEAQLFFSGMPPALPLVRQGQLRALAVSTKTRFPSAPDVPTMEQSGVQGFVADNWHGVLAPAGMPNAYVARIDRALSNLLESPEVKEKFLAAGAEAKWTSSADFQKLVVSELERWDKVAKAVGISHRTANRQ